jgi:3',5'-cyclic AMP phosphodiesterase CpdA
LSERIKTLRIVAHLSDLHFGRTDSATLPALANAIAAAKPDVVVVCGDLTQRARTSEFEEARRFLETLPKPQIVVPGNHDIPLYNVVSRWLVPLDNFRRYISGDLAPFYADDEIAILGINTARSWTFKNGRINRDQVARGCARLALSGEHVTRIVVTHHPYDVPGTEDDGNIVGRAQMAMAGFAQCRVDMILSGHLHVGHISQSATRYKIPRHSALVVQSGTATSSRRRGENNSFNIIAIDGQHVRIDRLTWDGTSFMLSETERFESAQDGWSRVGDRYVAERRP